MKLYYDTLIAFMPDSVRTEDGRLIQDPQKLAGRKALIELAKYQNEGNIMSLYQSVLEACIYAGVDLVDTILQLSAYSDKVEYHDMPQILIDHCAKMLFQSIKPDYDFNIELFLSNILTAAHDIMNNQIQLSNKSETAEVPSEDDPSIDSSEDSGEAGMPLASNPAEK